MLEQLESIPWSRLRHAYGPASDVPKRIRALAGANKESRREALGRLYSSIFHQGTRWQATPYAIPFLYELLRDATIPDRHEIIYLLAKLALGYEEAYLPDGLDPVSFRRQLTEADQRVSSAEREKFRKFGYGPQVDLDCYEAARQGVPTLVTLLDDEPQVRRAAVYALAWFPEHVASSMPRIIRLLKEETDPPTLATAILTTGLLTRWSGVGGVEMLHPFLDHEALLIRVTAAIGLARDALDDRIIDILARALSHSKELQALSAGVPFNDGHLVGYVSLVLSRYGATNREMVVPALCRALRASSPFQSLDVTRALLRLCVVGSTTPIKDTPVNQLDKLQFEALLAIAHHGGWQINGAAFANYGLLVHAYGVPSSQKALGRYLERRRRATRRR
jgi:hypothetical protein